MCGAADARIMIPNHDLGRSLEFIIGKIEMIFHEMPQIMLDRPLVLRRRRHDDRIRDNAVFVE